MTDLVKLEGVTKECETGSKTLRAVDDVTTTIERGEFAIMLGPSGSGHPIPQQDRHSDARVWGAVRMGRMAKGTLDVECLSRTNVFIGRQITSAT